MILRHSIVCLFVAALLLPASATAGDPLDDILHGSSSSASSVSSTAPFDPLNQILSEMHGGSGGFSIREGSGGGGDAPLNRAIAALNAQIAAGQERLRWYKERHRQTLLSRRSAPTFQEQSGDDQRKSAMDSFGRKIEAAKIQADRGRDSRERCLSADPKYQLDKANMRSCDMIVQTIRSNVESLQDDSHNLDIAIAGAGRVQDSKSAWGPTPVPMRDPWNKDSVTKW